MAAGKPSALEQRRAEFARYKEDVKKRGKPFYPYAMFEDTIIEPRRRGSDQSARRGLEVTSWSPHHDGTHQGLLGPEFTRGRIRERRASSRDRTGTSISSSILLRIFKWPETVFLGTVGVPTIALILLIGVPFYDVRRERRLSQRPVPSSAPWLVVLSMASSTWKGATASEALASEVILQVPSWIKAEKLPPAAQPGAKLFAVAGCTCLPHVSRLGAPSWARPISPSIGTRNLGVDFQIRHLKCPSCVNPGSPMPKFASLGEKSLRQLALLL